MKFAQHLRDGLFLDAYAMLSDQLKPKYSPSKLRDEFMEMLTFLDEDPASSKQNIKFPLIDCELNVENTLDAAECNSCLKNIIGWAYVSVCCGECNEAVSGTVINENGSEVIAELEWMRP
jgi:hypothetical protein